MKNPVSFKSILFLIFLIVVLLLSVSGIFHQLYVYRENGLLDSFSLYTNVILLIVAIFLTILAFEFYQIRKNTGINYQKIFNGSPYAIYIMEKKTLNFLAVNESMSKLYGYTEKEFLAMSAFDIRPESEKLRIKEYLEKYGELTNESGVWLHQKKNGECFYVQITFHSVPLAEKEAFLVMVTDVNQSINYEKEINELLHLYETVNKATNDVIWDYDLVSDKLNWMPGYKETFGYEIEAVPNSFWAMNKIHEDDREAAVASFKEVVVKKEKSWLAEYRYICADGSIKYIADRGYVIFDEAGEPIRMIGAMQDVSSRKKYEQQLLHQNEQLKEIAWINSHQVRRPLSNILGLINLIKGTHNGNEELDHLIDLLGSSSKELDDALVNINQQAKDGKIDIAS